MRWLLVSLVAIFAVLLLAGFAVWLLGADQLDRRLNRVAADPDAPVSTAADLALHRDLFVADLHADTLKWERDLLTRSAVGHVDLPRLVDGNVGLQVFTIVTKSPIPRSHPEIPGERCVSGSGINVAGLLSFAQGRPAWSLRERAIWQVRRLYDAAERSRQRPGPELRVITDAEDLRRLLADRRAGKQVVGAILGIEGGHWIGAEGDPAADGPAVAERVRADMRQLFDLGVRMFAPTHRFDNALSGSSEGCEAYGLTPQGRVALQAAEELGMAVDLSHISPKGFRDALEMLEAPAVVSHTGLQWGCEAPCRPARNLSDEEVRLLIENGGVVGVGYWPQALGPSVLRIADVMAHIMDLAREMGREPGRHVAFGSDYDGSVTPFFDASQVATLTTILRRHGPPFDAETIRRIAGLNTCRLFAQRLPGGGPDVADEICTAE